MDGEHWWPQKGWRRSFGKCNPMILIGLVLSKNCLLDAGTTQKRVGTQFPSMFLYIGDLDTDDLDD
jgi:hypothetical protein